MEDLLKKSFEDHAKTIESLRNNPSEILQAAETLKELVKHDGHLFVCGNGGSAADSQHISGEWRGHFEKERKPLRATALSVDTSTLTAIGNDYGFEFVFSRQLEALAKPGDVLIAISTSGNSQNILKAAESAKKLGVKVIGLTGENGGKLKKFSDIAIKIPSSRTPRIQEGHELVFHILCELIDSEI
jgi:D-sedoheptulose 7-phosphate isomerase